MNSTKMKAAICSAYGSPDVLKIELVDKPSPGPKELLIKIMASAVNSGDVKVRGLDTGPFLRGMMRLIFGFRKPRNGILGTVYAGIVEQKGKDVTGFHLGDEVYGLSGFGFGCHAEYRVVKETSILTKKPANATFEEAAAIAFGGQTAIYFLEKTKLAQGTHRKILVYGSSGSVGTSAIQIAKYYHAEVTAVCSTKGKELITSLGVDHLVFYDKEDFTKKQLKYDVIFDAVGKLSKKQCSHLLNPGGIFLTVGGLDYATEKKEQLEFLRDLFEEGKYKAAIDRVYSLDDIAEAHRYADTGRKKGNVVVKMSS